MDFLVSLKSCQRCFADAKLEKMLKLRKEYFFLSFSKTKNFDFAEETLCVKYRQLKDVKIIS